MNSQALPAQVHSAFSQLLDTIGLRMPAMAQALALGAIPLSFDRELLAVLRAQDDGLEDQLLQRMAAFSFVHSRNGRYSLSPEARRQLLEQWHDDDPGYRQANQRALTYYNERLDSLAADSLAPDESLIQGQLLHLLAVQEEEGLKRLHHLFRKAQDDYRLGDAEQYVRVAYEQRPFLSPAGQMYLDHMQGLVDQFHGRWTESAALSRDLLAAEGLPPELAPRVQRSMARSLVALQHWDEGLALYAEALDGFQELGDDSEAGRTMAELGRAYLNLALGLWGSGWLQAPPARSRFQWLADLGNLLAHLPLVIYLMYQLGVGTMLPVAHRLARDMDWTVGRLLGSAGRWLRRAEQVLSQAEDLPGKIAAQEGLAQLYRLLNHPLEAASINLDILNTPEVDPVGYRAARAKLGLAYALLQEGKADESRQLLEEALPIFRTYGHLARIAQTQTLLARAELLAGDADEATWHYLDALDSWQLEGNLAAVTDVVHELDDTQRRSDLSLEAREEIAHATRQVNRRRYPIRYSHPVLTIFHQVSLLLLVAVLFFALRLAIRTRSGVLVGTAAPLIQPVHGLLPGEPLPAGVADTEEWTPPPPLLLMEDQLNPELHTRFLVPVVLSWFLVYLVTYTLVGLGFILRLPLDSMQANWMQALEIDEGGLDDSPHHSARLGWEQITELYLSDRIVIRRPLSQVSFFAAMGETLSLEVSALARHYRDLQLQVRNRLPAGVPVHDLGFRLWRTTSGWIFLASLAFLLLFVVLSKLAPELLMAYPLPIPYNLSDLHGLAYLAVALCLAWWFVVQPLRVRFAVRPETSTGWWVGGAGLILAALHLLQFSSWRLPLGRPDLALGVLAILFVQQAAVHIRRARPLGAQGADAYVYPQSIRRAVLLVAVLIIAVVSVTLVFELVGFHFLARGNHQRHEAEQHLQMGQVPGGEEPHQEALKLCDQPTARPVEADRFYEAALQAYDASRALRREPAIDNNRGVILAQLGKYEHAVAALEEARAHASPFVLAGEPDWFIFSNNLARTYEEWAAATDDPLDRLQRILRAIDVRRSVISQLRRQMSTRLPWSRTNPCDDRTKTTLLHLGKAYYNLSYAYQGLGDNVLGKEESARSEYEQAVEAFKGALGACEQDPGARAALGWTHIQLGRLDDNYGEKRSFLRRALGEFEAALSGDTSLAFEEVAADFDRAMGRSRGPSRATTRAFEDKIVASLTDQSALMGQAWANYFLAVTYPRCEDEGVSLDEAGSFREHTEKAIAAFEDTLVAYERAATAHEKAAEAYARRGAEEQAQSALERARSLRKESAVYHRTSAQLHYALRRCTEDRNLDLERFEWALAAYDKAVALDPCHAKWHIRRGNLHYALAQAYRADKPDTAHEHDLAMLDAYGEALKLDSSRPSWHTKKGDLHLSLAEWYKQAGDPDTAHEHVLDAIEEYQAVSDLKPTNAWHRVRLGDAAHDGASERRAAGDSAEADRVERIAVKAYSEASKLPDDKNKLWHRALWKLARSLYWLGEYEGSVEASSLAMKTPHPKEWEIPMPYFYRGMVHAVDGDLQAALREFLHGIPDLDGINEVNDRNATYDIMLEDLGSATDIDPAALAFFAQVVERARSGNLQGHAFQVRDAGPDGLALRSGPGATYAVVDTLRQGVELVPLACNPEGTWLYVQDRNTRELGWLPAGSETPSCAMLEAELPDLMLPNP